MKDNQPSPLDTVTRLKLARGIIDKTCQESGAGYVLIMFVPGTDTVLRSFRGLDTPEECIAAIKDTAQLLTQHANSQAEKAAKNQKELHNGS